MKLTIPRPETTDEPAPVDSPALTRQEVYVYTGPPLGAVTNWNSFLPPPPETAEPAFTLPTPSGAGPTPEDPDAVAVLADDDPRHILQRKTIHPGDARKESYLDREEFLKSWRG